MARILMNRSVPPNQKIRSSNELPGRKSEPPEESQDIFGHASSERRTSVKRQEPREIGAKRRALRLLHHSNKNPERRARPRRASSLSPSLLAWNVSLSLGVGAIGSYWYLYLSPPSLSENFLLALGALLWPLIFEEIRTRMKTILTYSNNYLKIVTLALPMTLVLVYFSSAIEIEVTQGKPSRKIILAKANGSCKILRHEIVQETTTSRSGTARIHLWPIIGVTDLLLLTDEEPTQLVSIENFRSTKLRFGEEPKQVHSPVILIEPSYPLSKAAESNRLLWTIAVDDCVLNEGTPFEGKPVWLGAAPDFLVNSSGMRARDTDEDFSQFDPLSPLIGRLPIHRTLKSAEIVTVMIKTIDNRDYSKHIIDLQNLPSSGTNIYRCVLLVPGALSELTQCKQA